MAEAQAGARLAPSAPSETEAALAVLGEEMATYRQHLPELLQRQEGQYVVIKGANVIAVFPDRSEALREAYRLFGVVPFLVRQIAAIEPWVYLPNVVP